MYDLVNTRGGAVIGTTESPRFIYKKSTGCFVETDEANAQGIAYKGEAYNLLGRDGVGVERTVMLVQFDEGVELYEHRVRIAAAEAAEAALEDALCEEDMAAEQRIAEIENALCELDERSA